MNMKKILLNGKEFSEYEYLEEKEFESDIVNNSREIFGEKTFYIDLKKINIKIIVLFQMGIYWIIHLMLCLGYI